MPLDTTVRTSESYNILRAMLELIFGWYGTEELCGRKRSTKSMSAFCGVLAEQNGIDPRANNVDGSRRFMPIDKACLCPQCSPSSRHDSPSKSTDSLAGVHCYKLFLVLLRVMPSAKNDGLSLCMLQSCAFDASNSRTSLAILSPLRTLSLLTVS